VYSPVVVLDGVVCNDLVAVREVGRDVLEGDETRREGAAVGAVQLEQLSRRVGDSHRSDNTPNNGFLVPLAKVRVRVQRKDDENVQYLRSQKGAVG